MKTMNGNATFKVLVFFALPAFLVVYFISYSKLEFKSLGDNKVHTIIQEKDHNVLVNHVDDDTTSIDRSTSNPSNDEQNDNLHDSKSTPDSGNELKDTESPNVETSSKIDNAAHTSSNVTNATVVGSDNNNNGDVNSSTDIDMVLSWDKETYKDIIAKRQQSDENIDVTLFLPDENITAQILHDGQLVVNLVNDTQHMLWHNGQSRLCSLLQGMTLTDTIPAPVSDDLVELPRRPLLNYTLACDDMFKNLPAYHIGEGNWITVVYNTRITTAAARVDFQFNCYEGRQAQMKRLLPWLQTYQTAPSEPGEWPYQGDLPNYGTVCSNKYPSLRVDLMVDEITNDMQKMGVTLIGSREGKVHPDVPVSQPPLIPNIEVEDVVIHFRCGDIMGGAIRYDFGLIKFSEYKKWISTDAKTIGIVTQPFEKENNRIIDSGKVEHCKAATYLLVDKLQSFLPSAKISIHNGVNDTLPLTYARLIMADQSFTTLSSFGIFPVVGSFGKGYFQRGNRGVNPFNMYFPTYHPEKHFMMDGEFKASGTLRKMNLTSILAWLGEED